MKRTVFILNDFYEKHHRTYFNTTVNIDPSCFLEALAKRLRPGATVLDIGCGSGRDLLWFSEQGFHPTGFEQSTSLAALAREHSGCDVIVGDFLTFDFSALNYDAVVLIGSLVHVEKDILPKILVEIVQALKENGLMYVSLKARQGRCNQADGRIFVLWSPKELEPIFLGSGLNVEDFFISQSKKTRSDQWLNFLLRKQVHV